MTGPHLRHGHSPWGAYADTFSNVLKAYSHKWRVHRQAAVAGEEAVRAAAYIEYVASLIHTSYTRTH